MDVKLFFEKIGVDKAVAYSSGARFIQAITGIGSIFFIATFLTGVEQGFYYTFGSIVAIQVFFELGFTGVITQYVAHEVSHLKIENGQKLIGEKQFQSRLSSLLHFCVKWYCVISLFAFFTLLAVGYFFFSHYGGEHNTVQWKIPWLLICFGTVIKLFQSPLNSFIQGLGYVKEMNKISFYQQLILPISIWLGLICGFKLYVVGISSTLAAIIWYMYVRKNSIWILLKNIWLENIIEHISYRHEIFPYQWRIALSWISGYFIYQLFNPVLFATEGAKIAGQMGMTLTVINAIQAFNLSWINTKIPQMSALIARKEYSNLDLLFNKTFKQMCFVGFFIYITMFFLVIVLKYSEFHLFGDSIADRFLDPLPMLLMIVAIMEGQIVYAWATYLRCHKREPFLLYSLVLGALTMGNTFILGNLFGLYGICIGYCCICIFISMPWAYIIFRTKKILWHKYLNYEM